ncbi:MAG: LysR family transcriptional regulator [Myxococcota bacterium]|nr:LysR family transcriptional regulator [Myxococcota bacterium]
MLNLTLDQLQVLEAIDRLGSFSAAANELHRATSAVSYSVKSLEAALELELFDRSGHRAVLTDGGRLVLEEARGVLERARRIETLADQLQQGWEPRLLVVLDGVLPMKPAMRALKRFTAEDLPTTVELRVEYLAAVRQRFDEDGADLMLTVDQVSDPTLVIQPMAPMEMMLVVHHAHPLAARRQSCRRADFHSHVELLVAPASARGMPHVKQMFFGGPHVFELSDFHSKLEALREGVGFGWMPNHLVAPYLDDGALVRLEFDEGNTHLFTPQLAYRSGYPLGRAAKLFKAFIEEEMER